MEAGHGGSLNIQDKQSAQGQTLSQRDPMSKKKRGGGLGDRVRWRGKKKKSIFNIHLYFFGTGSHIAQTGLKLER